jgi:hypothetical protein
MGWTVRYNHLGAIGEELPRRMDDAVGEAAEGLALILKGILWIDTGMVRRVTTDAGRRHLHAEVWIGYNRGHGFYSRFQEWGTIKQAARPIVGPTSEVFRPRYIEEMSQAVSEACDAQ